MSRIHVSSSDRSWIDQPTGICFYSLNGLWSSKNLGKYHARETGISHDVFTSRKIDRISFENKWKSDCFSICWLKLGLFIFRWSWISRRRPRCWVSVFPDLHDFDALLSSHINLVVFLLVGTGRLFPAGQRKVCPFFAAFIKRSGHLWSPTIGVFNFDDEIISCNLSNTLWTGWNYLDQWPLDANWPGKNWDNCTNTNQRYWKHFWC